MSLSLELEKHKVYNAESQGRREFMAENEISAQILDAAISVHTELGGPGVLES